MKLLLAFRNRQSVEPFTGVVRGLLRRAHTVHLVVPAADAKLSALLEPHPRLSIATGVGLQRADDWRDAAPLLRSARDYLQYLRPAYRDARKLRRRAFGYLLDRIGVESAGRSAEASDAGLSLSEESVWRVERLAALCEDAIPADPIHERTLAQFEPDAVLISPVVHFGSAQADFVKAARALGIPVGMMLFSWDNLSTKGALHVAPDRLFVWNERQRREAAELHGVPAEHIRVTGAPRFDGFFARQPLVDRATFCAAAGLDPVRPIVLYLCSSKLVSEREAAFIRRWHAAVRSSGDPALRTASLVVRPHPDLPVSDKKWLGPEDAFRWSDDGGPTLFKRRMFGHPSTVMIYSDDRGASLYESIRHSHAVVALNTSAEIEAGILGRPVFTILADEESADGQQSTLHFKYLLKEDGGFVSVSSSLDEHVRELSAVLASPPSEADIQRRVAEFIRPAGWDRPASDVLIDAVEREFGQRMAPRDARGTASFQRRSGTVLTGPALDRRLPSGGQVRLVRVGYAAAELYVATSSPEEAANADIERHSPCVLTWLEQDTRPGQTLFVAPGDTGVLSLVAARGLGLAVFAFEANIPRLARLWENVVLNGCEGTLVPIPIMLSARRGLKKERFGEVGPISSREVPARSEWHQHRESSAVVQACPALTLDGAVKTWTLPPPEILYLGPGANAADIVGGAARALAQSIRLVLIESGGADAAAARIALSAAGFARADEEQVGQRVVQRFRRG